MFNLFCSGFQMMNHAKNKTKKKGILGHYYKEKNIAKKR